ncbi:MAG: helix-hairpin-helix domain-containing protein [Chitinophagales bacterium]|nr:helix-hairpin-helix domain-containing protein [Bacteroidota bacterium]MCB9043374.1 helix-hairpin-helix domain-containing protein [Chitinophagales bacterium]
MKKYFDNWLKFSRQDIRAVFLLLGAVIAVNAVGIYKQNRLIQHTQAPDNSFYTWLQSQDSVENKTWSEKNNQFDFYREFYSETKPEPFFFDPNTISTDDCQRLGFSERVCNTLNNFRQKGGKFYQKSDFKKVYGISEADYERLQDYIEISNNNNNTYAEKTYAQADKFSRYEKKEQNYAAKNDKLFYFNPNKITYSICKNLSIDEQACKAVIAYVQAGKTIKTVEEFAQISKLPDAQLAELKPFISFPKNFSEENAQASESAYNTSTKANVQLFSFDPNTLTLEEAEKLGISEKQYNNIVNYRSKVPFKTKEDFAKLYTLSDQQKENLLPYVQINTANIASPQNEKYAPKKNLANIPTINLNQADAENLKQLPGIGDVLAQRITDYRTRLGGFVSPKQLLEVDGIDAEKLAVFEEKLQTNTQQIKRININIASEDELLRHPYINYTAAQAILSLRKKLKKFSSTEDLQKAKALTPVQYQKILPYVEVE